MRNGAHRPVASEAMMTKCEIRLPIDVAQFLIEMDAEATCACYAKMPEGPGCDCSLCENFRLVGHRAFPTAVHVTFGQLGVDFSKPAEVCDYFETRDGLRKYGVSYYFIGRLANPPVEAETIRTLSFRRFSAEVEYEFAFPWAPIPEPMKGMELVQFEFAAMLPWLLNPSLLD